jgi:uncharacterized protein (DUF2147 family)
MCTAKGAQLRAHVTSKHDKVDPLTCFPGLPAMEAAEAAAIAAAAAPAKPVVKKEKKDKGPDLSALLDEGLKVSKKK